MALVFKEQKEEGFVVGTWRIDENLEWFEKNFDFTEEEQTYYKEFLVESRKKQWLSSRLLVKELYPECGEISYNTDGKPFFRNKIAHLSVSHSYNFASAIISKTKNVGIDIEKASERLIRVKDRFLSEKELGDVDRQAELRSLCTYWCAKEAIYKLHGMRKLDFRDHILIDPFKVEEKGNLSGRIIKKDQVRNFRLSYQQLEDYMLVFLTE